MSGAATRLVGAVLRDAAANGCAVAVEHVGAVPWASITFSGERHTLALTAAACPAVEAWLARLPEAELRVAGWLVAECAVDARAGMSSIVVEVLLLET